MTDRLVVDWTACRGRGICSELLPERITLDEWGYPLVDADVPPELLAHARRAVDACPRALRLSHSRSSAAPQPVASPSRHRAARERLRESPQPISPVHR